VFLSIYIIFTVNLYFIDIATRADAYAVTFSKIVMFYTNEPFQPFSHQIFSNESR